MAKGMEASMRRLLSALAATIVAGTAAGGQSQSPRFSGFSSPPVTQPLYGSSRPPQASDDGFPAPAIPVVLSREEEKYVSYPNKSESIPPCAGEPFFVSQRSVRVPYWAMWELTGPGAGIQV